MAYPKEPTAEERASALSALVALDAIPYDDPDRKGAESIYSHARIVQEIRKAIPDPLTAHEVARALTREGYIGAARGVRIIGADGSVRHTKAAYVHADKAAKAV